MEAGHIAVSASAKPSAKGLDYLMHVPTAYARSRRKWPVVLFLHGSGERGNDVWQVCKNGPPKLLKQGWDAPAIVVSPQCPSGSRWDAHYNTLIDLLADVAGCFRTDQCRTYLTGLSMGGYGTWEMGALHPTRFAALLPICGGVRSTFKFAQYADGLKNMPIWCFHGARDDIVPLRASEVLVDRIRSIGGAPLFTIYPRVGHVSWIKTYANPDVWAWLFKQKQK